MNISSLYTTATPLGLYVLTIKRLVNSSEIVLLLTMFTTHLGKTAFNKPINVPVLLVGFIGDLSPS